MLKFLLLSLTLLFSNTLLANVLFLENFYYSVEVVDGILRLEHDLKYMPPILVTRPITYIDGDSITITRRTKIHYNNPSFVGTLQIIIGKKPVCSITYKANDNGFYLGNSKVKAKWNEWFVERFSYTPQTGEATYSVGSETITTSCNASTSNGLLRISTSPRGNYTGHHIKIDSVEISALNWNNDYLTTLRERGVLVFLSEYSKVKSANTKVIEMAYKQLDRSSFAELIQFKNLFVSDAYYESLAASVYDLVKEQDSISGYQWFISEFPSSKISKQALSKIHNLSFALAKSINTISSYNDFLIAFPIASQVETAQELAYNLEKSEYTGFFSNEEKEARRLLVQSKILEQSSEDLQSGERVGYIMIVNRMNELLKAEFSSTDATLRHLESNEFKSFVKIFKRNMKDLSRKLSRIAKNTEDLSFIMKNQNSIMNNHFENAAQDQEMASALTKQHRQWERFIGEVGL